MGRVNAGKTTILQRVCNTTDLPEVIDGKGNKVCIAGYYRSHHNIRDQLIFQSNQYFIFYDSCGFEAGSDDGLEKMEFVDEHASTPKLKEQIHAR
ncbi:hypothetical protein ID866_11714 [Astraeus odoratus]|nr:hypothetical protein ID866_11714 [Astraeus odoratus]